MVGGKSDANNPNIRKTQKYWSKSWLGKPVEAGEEIGEREKERTVKELALYVEKSIDEGLHRTNSDNSDRDCYFHNNSPSTSAMALAEKAAIQYQVREDEAEGSSNYVEYEQSEELEAENSPIRLVQFLM